jgi:arylsulfatase A-like enzyme
MRLPASGRRESAGNGIIAKADVARSNSLADNTLVIFTSDNGPEITGEVNPGVYDRLQQYRHASMDGLRGAKRDLWEGGPFIARWPGRIPAGTVSDETMCHVDLLATVAARGCSTTLNPATTTRNRNGSSNSAATSRMRSPANSTTCGRIHPNGRTSLRRNRKLSAS